MKLILTTLLFVSFYFFAQAQDTIFLKNPSFEGVPYEGASDAKLPLGWVDCGFPRESPPDVHPVIDGTLRVKNPANNLKTYIGMVTRDNDTWERIGGELTLSFKKGNCYDFSLKLARSEDYWSYSKLLIEKYDSAAQANYAGPIVLRIYGGNSPCEMSEMIGRTGLVRNTEWLTFNFKIQPAEDYKYITFEAFYITPTLVPYNGNILLDNASPFVEIPCEPKN